MRLDDDGTLRSLNGEGVPGRRIEAIVANQLNADFERLQPRVGRHRSQDPEFEQMLKRFMRQSEERQVDFKRSVEHKRR